MDLNHQTLDLIQAALAFSVHRQLGDNRVRQVLYRVTYYLQALQVGFEPTSSRRSYLQE